METKPTATELLCEARDALEYRRETLLKVKARAKKFGAVLFTEKQTELTSLDDVIARIDAYLAAPSESAMEIVRKIRGNDDEIGFFHLTDAEAAALIEGYGRRVPRAMIQDVFDSGIRSCFYNEGDDHLLIESVFNTIAAKHGVVIE